MATTRVFVDNAVEGELPPVCARTGEVTADHLVMTVPVGGSEGFGIAWLLLLTGPVGWLGLFIYASVRRVETLTVKLPYCDEAYAELANVRRTRRNAGLATIAFFVMALFVVSISRTFTLQATAAALGVLGVGMLLTYILETLRIRRVAVRVQLDGSRRWVTLSNVSDAFAEAVTQSQREPGLNRR